MAETLMKIVFDCATGESTEIPLTADEIADLQAQAEAEAAAQAAAEAEEAAKAAARESALEKLAELGLTADEIAALTE